MAATKIAQSKGAAERMRKAARKLSAPERAPAASGRAAAPRSEAIASVASILPPAPGRFSEETVIISTAREGKLTRHLDAKALTALLTDLFAPESAQTPLASIFKRKEGAQNEKE